MFKKTSLSSIEISQLEAAKAEILRVSPAKPLAYLEKGLYQGKIISPRCIAYVPNEWIRTLMDKEDVFIIANENDGVKEIKADNINHPRIILLSDSSAGNKTLVFDKQALKELLMLNSVIALSMLNSEKEKFERIDDNAVIEFVKLIGRHDFSDYAQSKNSPIKKALVDAAFADKNIFFENSCWSKIKLTDKLNEVFKDKKLSIVFKVRDLESFTSADWANIADEYKEKKSIMASRESMRLITSEIDLLARGIIKNGLLLNICKYINNHPDRKLSIIIRSKSPSTAVTISELKLKK